MVTNVRAYTDRQILDKIRTCPSFRGFPAKYWLVGVRSNEDAFNRFDDKFYCFKGEQFIATWKCTTNAGTDMLNPTNSRGEAVLKTGDIYYDSHERRKHRGKVMAYCQRLPLPLHRDNDGDRKTEESGTAHDEIVGINIHPASYQFGSRVEREAIQGWGQGCQVFAIREDFDDFMKSTEGQSVLTYALLLEWDPTQIKPFTEIDVNEFAGLTDDEIDIEIPVLESAAVPAAGTPEPVTEAFADDPAGDATNSAAKPPTSSEAVGFTPEKFNAFLPQIDTAKSWIKRATAGTMLGTAATFVFGLPQWLQIGLFSLLMIIVIGGIVMFVMYHKEIFAYVTKMNTLRATDGVNDPVIVGKPPTD